MKSPVLQYSANICTYLILKFAQWRYDVRPSESEIMVAENLGAWLEKFPQNPEEDPEAVNAVQADLLQELSEGSYLDNGAESYIKRVAEFVGDENHLFVRLVKEAIEKIQKENLRG